MLNEPSDREPTPGLLWLAYAAGALVALGTLAQIATWIVAHV